jgi:hypothetical protein
MPPVVLPGSLSEVTVELLLATGKSRPAMFSEWLEPVAIGIHGARPVNV